MRTNKINATKKIFKARGPTLNSSIKYQIKKIQICNLGICVTIEYKY